MIGSRAPRSEPDLESGVKMMLRKSVVIGTAGHIDHGKTALVKLLTGIDTDRLKEEKERGISIDLGFAHLSLPSGIEAGIVDVPGHERFVRNMLAGAGGIDIVLFIVAADEGAMPQTFEHLNIVNILRVHGGVVALTKIDLVDAAWLEMVRSDVRSIVAGTVLENAPIVPVSSISGEGKEGVIKALDMAAAQVPEIPGREFVRLPIDRVFTVEGFGTVVTGTLWSGHIKVGDNLEIIPQAKKIRVRNVQVFGKDVSDVLAGQRVALALHPASREELARGDWLVTPGALSATSMVDTRFDLLKDVPKPLKTKSRIRFHLGASEVIGRIYFLEREELKPGESSFAQLRLESPVLTVEGDRFVIRSYSPQLTIGGGSVLVSHSSKHKRNDTEAVDTLTLIEHGSPLERVEHAIRVSAEKGIEISELARQAGVQTPQLEEALRGLTEKGKIPSAGSVFIHADSLSALMGEVASCLRDYQEHYRLRWGMTKGELRNRFGRISAEVFSAILDALVKQGKLFIKEDKVRIDSPNFNLSEEETRLKGQIERDLLDARFNVPSIKDLAPPDRQQTAGDILQILAEEGKVVKVTTELFFHSARMGEAEKLLKGFLSKNGTIQVTEFKDLINVTRKFAVPLLEYFDRKGITRRQGDVRVLAKK
jgi:selenocysteine-specific elongation factor